MIWVMFVCVCSEGISKELRKKLEKFEGKALEFDDREMKQLLYADYSDVFVLYYYNQLISSKLLLANWNKASGMVFNSSSPVVFGKVDLGSQKKSFSKLQLTQHPCAVFLSSGYFFNYTGPFDSEKLFSNVIGEKYLKTQAYPNIKPLKFQDYLHRFLKQIINKNPVVLLYLSLLFSIFLILIYAFYYSYCRKKPEIKDD